MEHREWKIAIYTEAKKLSHDTSFLKLSVNSMDVNVNMHLLNYIISSADISVSK